MTRERDVSEDCHMSAAKLRAEYIKREAAIAIIEEKQKELCPVGRYGRGYVYGSDREKYDAWDEIIDALENTPAADVAPVVHGRWIHSRYEDCSEQFEIVKCSQCNHEAYAMARYVHGGNYCPNCGAMMDGGADHACL